MRSLTHRCHLDPPLSDTSNSFLDATLSGDYRTCELVKSAVKQLTNVTTLRVIHGHAHLTEALLRCFFDSNRALRTPVQRLWLESSRVDEALATPLPYHRAGLPLVLDFRGLKSVRVRRLPLSIENFHPHRVGPDQVRGRIASKPCLENWRTAMMMTVNATMPRHSNKDEVVIDEARLRAIASLAAIEVKEPYDVGSKGMSLDMPAIIVALMRDNEIYQGTRTSKADSFERPSLQERMEQMSYTIWSVHGMRKHCRTSLNRQRPFRNYTDLQPMIHQTEVIMSSTADRVLNLTRQSCMTLTSINLDALQHFPGTFNQPEESSLALRCAWFERFFKLRFANLRALQIRTDVEAQIALPHGLYLFQPFRWPSYRFGIHGSGQHDREQASWLHLEFLAVHTKLVCLGWPMSRLFGPNQHVDADIMVDGVQLSSSNIIGALANRLVDLRLDEAFTIDAGEQAKLR